MKTPPNKIDSTEKAEMEKGNLVTEMKINEEKCVQFGNQRVGSIFFK